MTSTRRAFLATASALTLSACGGLIGPPDAGQIYVLKPDLPAPAPASASVNWALAVMRPDAPGGLDTDRIALVQADGTMDYYAAAQYPDGLPDLVQAALIAGFETAGQVREVARAQDALHADYNLFTAIKSFEAHYGAPDAVPGVTVALTARLATAHGRKIVATYTASQTVPASANSAGAVVQALNKALGDVVQALAAWTVQAAPPLPPPAPAP